MYRDHGIYQTLKMNNQIDQTLLVEIGIFEKKNRLNPSFYTHKDHQGDDNVVSIEDVPFIGAELNFDKITKHGRKGYKKQNFVWIRLGRLTQLDMDHLKELVRKIRRADDPRSEDFDVKFKEGVTILVSSDVDYKSREQIQEYMQDWTSYSCYERR